MGLQGRALPLLLAVPPLRFTLTTGDLTRHRDHHHRRRKALLDLDLDLDWGKDENLRPMAHQCILMDGLHNTCNNNSRLIIMLSNRRRRRHKVHHLQAG
jgi:3',5'-cyclic AMP phosphodiesterase CpdA